MTEKPDTWDAMLWVATFRDIEPFSAEELSQYHLHLAGGNEYRKNVKRGNFHEIPRDPEYDAEGKVLIIYDITRIEFLYLRERRKNVEKT